MGEIDPVTVKYFAYGSKIKYVLRGEEHIIVGGDEFGGEQPPVPNFNLRKNDSLLEYMLLSALRTSSPEMQKKQNQPG